MLELLGQASLRTSFLAAAVQLGLVVLRVRSPQLRLLVWTVVLLSSLAMPIVQWATPVRLDIVPNFASALTEPAEPQWADPQWADPQLHDSVSQTPPPATSWPQLVYAIVAGALTLRLAFGVALSWRLVGRAVRVRPDWVPEWAANTRIRISPDIMAPVTVANVVLLPSDAMGWPSSMRDAVLAHERAHVSRRDFAMLLAAQLNRAIFWFSPFSWWLHRRLAELAELASDDQAMEATGDRPGYAELLLDMARRSGPVLRGVPMARPATLTTRIERILSGHGPTATAGPFRKAALAAGAVSLALLAAISRPDPRPGSALQIAFAPSDMPGPLDGRADLEPPPPSPLAMLEPTPSPEITTASQGSAPRSPNAVPASPSDLLTLPGPGPTDLRPQPAHAPKPSPSRITVQPVRAGRDAGAMAIPVKVRATLPAGSVSARAAPGGAEPRDSRVAVAPPTGLLPAEPPSLKGVAEPSCTGSYLPRQAGPRTDGPAELLQASYFQASDGTPWLKLLFGSRSPARLTGFDVERMSVRTTVVATLPRDTNRMAGTTHGAFGTIAYECIRPNAHL